MSSTSDSGSSWTLWFCSLRGNEFFCIVDDDYLGDRFNSTGLHELVPDFEEAMEYILDPPVGDSSYDNDYSQSDKILQPAMMLYGLIHARYILTSRGQQLMLEKYRHGQFGGCNLYSCDNHPLLPVGLSDLPGVSTVKLYCPKCENILLPRSSRHANVDGAYFGTSFAHLLFMVYPEYRPQPNRTKYIPKIFGFAIHPRGMQLQYDQTLKKFDSNSRRL